MRAAAVLIGAVFLVGVCTGAVMAAKQEDIWGMLKKDHDQMKNILKQLKNDKDGDQFNALQQMLTVHMKFEEQYLYPILEKNQVTREFAIQAKDEHNMAKMVMESMGKVHGDRAQWNAKVNELDQLLTTHIKNEEGKLFREGKRIITGDQARRFGAQYAQMQAQGGKQQK
jgi:hemerythrin superfamily protein